MATDETKRSIIEAAERLCARDGFFNVQMRDIVAEAKVSLAAINYHFQSKDKLLEHVFLRQTSAMNRERLQALSQAEALGDGVGSVADILRALVAPPLNRCLSKGGQEAAGARFVVRALMESAPPVRKILQRDTSHLDRFADALARALPDQSKSNIYWGLHFSLSMVRQTINDRERLQRLSRGACQIDDVADIVERIVELGVAALGRKKTARNSPARRRSSNAIA